MSLSLAASALTGTALALRWAWGDAGRRPIGLIAGGVLIVTAMSLAAQVVGWERGAALAVIVSAVPAFTVVAAEATWRTRRNGPDRGSGDNPAPTPDLWLRWLLAGPGAALAAVGLASALATWLPAVPGTRMIWAGLSVPVTWAGFAGWGLAAARPGRVLAVLAVFAVTWAGLAAVPFFA